MRWVIAYDIADDARRLRVADRLLACGARVQLSVFEIDISAAVLARLMDDLHAIIDDSIDAVRAYRTCHTCRDERILLGVSRNGTEDEDVVIV